MEVLLPQSEWNALWIVGKTSRSKRLTNATNDLKRKTELFIQRTSFIDDYRLYTGQATFCLILLASLLFGHYYIYYIILNILLHL